MNEFPYILEERYNMNDEYERINTLFDDRQFDCEDDTDYPLPKKRKPREVKPWHYKRPETVNFYARFEPLIKEGLFMNIICPGLPEQGER